MQYKERPFQEEFSPMLIARVQFELAYKCGLSFIYFFFKKLIFMNIFYSAVILLDFYNVI